MSSRILSKIASIAIFIMPLMIPAKMVDLGTYANTYPIKEKSFKVSIEEGIRDLNTSEIKERFVSEFNTLLEARSVLHLSQEEKHYVRDNTYRVPFEMIGPDGTIAYQRGDIIRPKMPKGQEIKLCFIDASNMDMVPLITKKFGKCIYFVANNRIDKVFPLIKNYSADGRIYPISERYTKRFNVTELPTSVRLYKDKIEYRTLNYKKLLQELGREKL